MTEIHKGYIGTALGSLHFRSAGPVDAAPLLLLHQTPSSSAMYEALMEELGEEYRMVAPDTPGFGSSAPLSQKPSIELYAQAIGFFLEALGISRCRVFGHHTGTSIAVRLAFENPNLVEHLALCGPTLLDEEQREELPKLAPPTEIAADGSHFLEIWKRIRGHSPQLPLPVVQREALLAMVAKNQRRAAYEAVAAQNFGAELAALRCPVLAFVGEGDMLRSSLEPSAALLAQGSMQLIPKADAYLCDTHAPQVAALLRNFFAGAA